MSKAVEEHPELADVVAAPEGFDPALRAKGLVELMKLRHEASDGWRCFPELCTTDDHDTGRPTNRFIDLFCLNLWRARKYSACAYEMKVSRSDFMREVDNPVKRSTAEKYAHQCYFVVPQGLVRPEEVPEGWGLFEVNAGGARRVKAATHREIPLYDMDFVARLVKRGGEGGDERVPKRLWLSAGKAMSFDEMIQLAEQHLGSDVQRRIAAARQEAVREYQQEAGQRDQEQIHRILSDRMRKDGIWHMTPEAVVAWLNSMKGGVPPGLPKNLERMTHALKELKTHLIHQLDHHRGRLEEQIQAIAEQTKGQAEGQAEGAEVKP